MYKTVNIIVKRNQKELMSYCKESCELAKQMKNTVIFRCRQILSADRKSFSDLHTNEIQILNEFDMTDDKRNGRKLRLPGWMRFDAVFKKTANPDYYNNLAMQSSQQIIKETLLDFKGYFASLKKYAKYPESFTGRPKLPHYVKSSQCSFNITNQDAVIKAGTNGNRYLKLPKTKVTVVLNSDIEGTLKEVIIKPFYDVYKISIVLEESVMVPDYYDNGRILGLDLGVDNFATSNNNCGLTPFIINGRNLKAYNQWYNKELSKLRSYIMKQKRFTSKRMNQLNRDHYCHTNDFYNKAASYIIKYCISNDIRTIVIGKNDGWKQNINIGRQNNQTFCFIGHAIFIKKLTLLAARYDIKVIETEESYTSKASLLNMDDMTADTVFSGRRIKRGLYKTQEGICINADVNGAGNVIRKVFTDAFTNIKDMSYMYKTVHRIQIV